MMSEAEYSSYKLRVLAKCGGANVHQVNGLLGRVGRIISAIQRGVIRLPQDLCKQQDLYNETVQTIGKLTHVFP